MVWCDSAWVACISGYVPLVKPPGDRGLEDTSVRVRCSEFAEWLLGALLGLLALGQSLRPGAILNLDFVLLPHAPVPDGVWGLGPDLPRRTPLLLPLAWLDPVIGSVTAGKLLAVACLAAAFVGASRLAGPIGWWRWSAGLVYAAGPFALTRLAVGHLFVLAAMAVLPFVLRDLLDPDRDPRRLYRGALALGLTGAMGGLLAGAAVVAGLAGRRVPARRKVWLVAVVAAAQAPWLVPGLVVQSLGLDLATSRGFATDLTGPGGAIGLLAGNGFWQADYQVGRGGGALVPLLGVGLLALAARGHRRLDADLRRLGPLAALALVVVIASGWEPVEGVYQTLTALPGVAVLREGQRLLVLYVLWAAVAAAAGARPTSSPSRLPGELQRVLPFVVATALVAPVLWGAGGQLRSVQLPDGWEGVRTAVRSEPGTVLALPWFQYLELDAAGGRNVLNPLPLWLGGDVIRSSDPRLPGQVARERGDPREPLAATLVARNLRGEPIAGDLAQLGVRWVVVLLDGDLLRGQPVGVLHSAGLGADPGLRRRVGARAIELYEVLAWRGEVTTRDGAPVRLRSIAGPVAMLDRSDAAVWARPGLRGWMRGWHRASVSPAGLVALPAGAGVVWYWPTCIVLLGYLLSSVLLLISLLRRSPRVDLT